VFTVQQRIKTVIASAPRKPLADAVSAQIHARNGLARPSGTQRVGIGMSGARELARAAYFLRLQKMQSPRDRGEY